VGTSGAVSVASSSGLRKGASAPHFLAMRAIVGLSVEMTILSRCFEARAAAIA